MPSSKPPRALSDAQIEQFIQDGFVRMDHAFPRELAEQGRAILWHDLPCDPQKPATWTQPVIRLGYYGDEPFRKAVNSPLLHTAFDQLVGKGRWRPRADLGTFPVRFPSPHDPGDAGWHVDLSFPGEDAAVDSNDYSAWRVNVTSRGRALLMLFLFSDVGESDAPTRIRPGSHLDMARLLEPAGEAGHVTFDAGRDRKRPARGSCDRRSRCGLSVPPVPRSRRANAPGVCSTIHGATTAAPVRTVQA